MRDLIARERLIVALDDPSDERCDDLVTMLPVDAGVSFFKVGPTLLLSRNGYGIVERIVRLGYDLFLDLKLYDTRDTVDRTVRAAFDLGARFVTVHATPSVTEAAMRAKPTGDRCRVLAVPTLTDADPADWSSTETREALEACDGIVCHPHHASFFQRWSTLRAGKILVCPGVRPLTGSWDDHLATWDNHAAPVQPAHAIAAGADYLVVGRPIWRAADPVSAARVIVAEMGGAR